MEPNQDPGNELLHLISWKRHEQPPPGYFNHFSERVIQRLESGEASGPTGFWQMITDLLETKPVLAGAYSLGLCSMLLMGISASQSLLQTAGGYSESLTYSPAFPDLILSERPSSRGDVPVAYHPSSMNPVFPSEFLRVSYPESPSLLQPVQFQLLGY